MSLIHWIRWSEIQNPCWKVNESIRTEYKCWKHISRRKTAYKMIKQWIEKFLSNPKLPWESDYESKRNFCRTSETIYLTITPFFGHLVDIIIRHIHWFRLRTNIQAVYRKWSGPFSHIGSSHRRRRLVKHWQVMHDLVINHLTWLQAGKLAGKISPQRARS